MSTITIIKEIALFVLMFLLQVLLLNRIALFGIAVPVLYIYFLIKLPIGRNLFYVIISSFLLGLFIDIFLNTPGVNAAATTIVATFRSVILNLFYSKVDFEEHRPGIHNFTFAFVKYAVTIVLFHQVVLFFIESLTLFNLELTLIKIGASSLLTLLIIFAIDAVSIRKDHSIG